MPPPVQYAKSGDLYIAYQVTGEGSVDLTWSPGATSHLELQWENPYAVRFIERLSTFCRLIRFDKRGTGMSHRPTTVATLEERTDDLRAILDPSTVRDLVAGSGIGFQDRGVHTLKGIPDPRQALTVAHA